LAEYLCLPIKNLVPVPDEIPDRMAVFCEPLAAALEISQQIHIQPTVHVLLIGAGRLGQLIAQAIALTGCDLRVVIRHPYQHKILEELGITTLTEKDVQQNAWDIVIDATGSAEGFEMARRAVRPRGTIVLKSTYRGAIEVNLSKLVVDEVTLIGSRCGPFPPALRALSQGLVDPSELISAQYPLSQAIQAFEHAARSNTLKILIDPREG
jgi:threonine dehydrogenase-like Zn-dependent dehydrogenase